MQKNVILIGYGGHAFVVYECISSMRKNILGYCDRNEVMKNPFHLPYLGFETNMILQHYIKNDFFIAIGNNSIRSDIFSSLLKFNVTYTNAIHTSAVLSPSSKIGNSVLVAQGAIVNALSSLNNGVIINTNASIDHECSIGDFSHIGPGATLCGNVKVGCKTFIGAGSVIREGIEIGNNCMIGAGSVVVKDIPDNTIFYGNPAKQIK